MGDTLVQTNICSIWLRAGAYQQSPRADVLGPYHLKWLYYWIQSWLQTSRNTCLIQKSPDSIYSTVSSSLHFISHWTMLAKNCVPILTILGTCWVPNLSNFPICQINTSAQFSFDAYNLCICLAVAVSSPKYSWKSILIQTGAVSLLIIRMWIGRSPGFEVTAMPMCTDPSAFYQ